ncbi:hypothetical protein WISP_23178 [Willisornis vidua]|uniref:Uncharacterized protein n=1 Tax=Willisornis vidua TaxID=1566151 RepID=A0ABQ9DS04_9PASS|nr:hypothetical protein WISP_23178 [Willisornis vidua]
MYKDIVSQTESKLVNVVLIFKEGKKEDVGQKRPFSLTAVPGKVTEKIILGGLEGLQSKYADYTKPGGAVASLEGREALQRDLDKSDDWATTNHMKFNKKKCWILQLVNEILGSSATERDLGVLVDGKWNMSQQCPGRQQCPGGHQAKHHQPVKGGDCPALLCTGAASP